MKLGLGRKDRVAEFAASVAKLYTRQLHTYLLRRLGRPHDVDDLAQTVYLRVLQMSPETAVQKPLAYVYTIAANVLREFRLKSEHEQAHVTIDTDEFNAWAEKLENVLPGDPEERLNLEQQIRSALEALAPREAAVLLMHKRDGLSYEEIARETGLSRTQVHRSIKQAKLAMRKRTWEK